MVNKKIEITLTLLVVVIFVVLAIGSGESSTPEKVTDKVVESNTIQAAEGTVSTAENKTSTRVAKAQDFKMGDTIKVGNLQFTLNSARYDEGGEYIKPEAGEKWLVINGTLENVGDEPEYISSLMMFELVDDEGYKRDTAIGPNTEGNLDGELAAGRKMRGEIAFSVKEGQDKWELIFDADVFGSGQAYFEINGTDLK